MARPMKDGVDYFPLDTDFLQDDKVRLIKGEFGAKGLVVVLALLCDIYRGAGYYKAWDGDGCLLMADAVGCGVTAELIAQVVRGCLRRGLFHEGVFEAHGVLTSPGIQRRYIRAVATREAVTLYGEYFLLDPDDRKDVPAGVRGKLCLKALGGPKTTGVIEGRPIDSEKTGVSAEETPQRKEKQTRGKGEQTEEAVRILTDWAGEDAELAAALQDFAAMRRQLKKPLTSRAARLILRSLGTLAEEGYPPVAVLEQSILNCWQGVFPLKGNRAKEADRSAGKAGEAPRTGGAYGNYL